MQAKNPGYYIRKQHRLKTFDYSSAATYFLTFNVRRKDVLLSSVSLSDDRLHAVLSLSPVGEIVDKYIRRIPDCYPDVTLDAYVIMPDHVHLLLTVNKREDSPSRQSSIISRIIRSTKTCVTKEVGYSFWQDDFYDEIPVSEKQFDRCFDYIRDNPSVWLSSHGAEPGLAEDPEK